MLRYPLIHPALLSALAGAGHGSKVLIADSNYAHHTNTNPHAPVIHLNLRPGLVTVQDVLETVLDACPIESATLMRQDDGAPSPVEADYRRMLDPAIPIDSLDRAVFYDVCRSRELTATVATGDLRHYANILLTVGFLPPPRSLVSETV